MHQERPQSDEIPRQGRAEQARLAGGRERFPQTAEARSGPDTMVPMCRYLLVLETVLEGGMGIVQAKNTLRR